MKIFVRHFFRKRSNYVIASCLLLIVLTGIFGEAFAPYDPLDVQIKDKLQPPSTDHWLGTDSLGRDVLSRIIVASRVSLLAALLVMGLSVSTGIILGLIAGYAGGLLDEILMRLTDVFLAFPPLILALTITAVLGPSLRNAMLAISISWWPWYARLVRGSVLSIKEKEFILAEHCIGASAGRIMLRHMLPNVVSLVIAQAALDMGSALVLASSLSFIGLGVQPPQPEWGAMISEGRRYVFVAWWTGAFPGLAIFITVYLFNAFGEALNVALSRRDAII